MYLNLNSGNVMMTFGKIMLKEDKFKWLLKTRGENQRQGQIGKVELNFNFYKESKSFIKGDSHVKQKIRQSNEKKKIRKT